MNADSILTEPNWWRFRADSGPLIPIRSKRESGVPGSLFASTIGCTDEGRPSVMSANAASTVEGCSIEEGVAATPLVRPPSWT